MQTAFTQIFSVAVFAIQAPLLGPRAFGLIAVVMIFTGFCELVLQEVATEALISMHEVDERHYATATAMNGLIGVIVGIGLFAVGGTLASAYRQPELAPLFRTMAVLPLLSSIGAAPNAEAKRRMDFRVLAIRMIAGVTCGGVAGIALTVAGAGVWALVWQALIQRAVCVGVLWTRSELKFQIAVSRSHLRQLLPMTASFFVSRSMSWASTQLPRLVLSVFLSTTELGLFSLASRFGDLIVQGIVVPRYIVARVQMRGYIGNVAAISTATASLLRRMSILCFPACLGGAVLGPLLIRVWLDPKWYGAVIPSQFLLLSTVATVSFYGGSAALVALNHMKWDAFVSVLQTVTMAATALIFGRYGLVVVSLALAIRAFALLPLQVGLLSRLCGVRARTFLSSQALPLLAAVTSAGCVWRLEGRIETLLGSVKALPVLACLGMMLYICVLVALKPKAVRELLIRSGPAT
jgi:PST family polysaccharide transporter